MTSLDTATTELTTQPPPGRTFDEEQRAAASFLARYNGRTLEAYRDDLRGFFQWAHDHDIEVMRATRPHIGLFRVSTEQRGLAAATIDRRLSTVCGFYKFAHIDGVILSNPAQYVRRPQVHPTEARGLDRTEFGVFLFTAERFASLPPSRSFQEQPARSISPSVSGVKGRSCEDVMADASTGAPLTAG